MRKTFIIFVLVTAIAVATFSQPTNRRAIAVAPGGSIWLLYAFSTASEAQDFAAASRLNFNRDAVVTFTSCAPSVGAIGAPSPCLGLQPYDILPHVVAVRQLCGSCGFGPNHPYDWQQFQAIPAAVNEYNAHAGSFVRGLFTANDGSIVVWWSKH